MRKMVLQSYYLSFLALLFSLVLCMILSPSYLLAREDFDQHTAMELQRQDDIERARGFEQLRNISTSNPTVRASESALPVDKDNDGMEDSWELAQGLDPNNPDDAWLDPDDNKVPNLFEYQLGSDPKSSLYPPIATVGPSGADYSDVGKAIESVRPGTVLRVAEGLYKVNYMVFDSKIIMIQGGWKADFSERDLKRYPTTFDGNMEREILYFSPQNGESTIILDGINFARGRGNFGALNFIANGESYMKVSIANCTVTESEETFGFGGIVGFHNWGQSKSDKTLINTIIGTNAGCGIYAQITQDSEVRWRIINSTISGNLKSGRENGKGISSFTLDKASLTATIVDSIIWGNEAEDVSISRNIHFIAEYSDIKSVLSSGAVFQKGAGVVNVPPLFVSPENCDFHLLSFSPLINAGIDKGIPPTDFEGEPRIQDSKVGMGADEAPKTFAKPDLALTKFSGPAKGASGGSITLTAVVKNQGQKSSKPCTAGIYLSEDPKIDPATDNLLWEGKVSNLAINGTDKIAATVKLPVVAKYRKCFIGIVVDPKNTVDEQFKTNNAKSYPLTF